MVVASLADARERMADPLVEVERGADVLVTREGALALPPTCAEEHLADLARFRESMPPLLKPGADLIREMRDGGC